MVEEWIPSLESLQKDQNIFELFPVSLLGTKTRLPYLVCLKKMQDKQEIHVDFKNLFSHQGEGLQESYVISTEDLVKAQDSLRYVLKSILQAAIAQKKNVVDERSLGYRERIQIENIKYLHIPWPAETQKGKPFQPMQDLHEVLCNFCTPYKVKKSEAASQKDPILEFFHELGTLFPETSIIDRVEWLLAAFLEEQEAFFASLGKISLQDEAYFFEHLERKMFELEKYLQQTSPVTQETLSSTFQEFRKKIAKVQSHRAILNQKLTKIQAYRLQTFAAPAKKCATQIAPSRLIAPQTQRETLSAHPPIPTHSEKILAFKEAIGRKDFSNGVQLLSALHQAADTLIAKKEYLAARELAMEVLRSLPVPSDKAVFWSQVPLQGQKNDYSELMTALVKDIWESSIRLKQPCPEPDDLIQLYKAQIIQVVLARGMGACDRKTLLPRDAECHPSPSPSPV